MEDMSVNGPPIGGSGDQYFNATFNPAPGSNMNDFSPFVSLIFICLTHLSAVTSPHPNCYVFQLFLSACISFSVFLSSCVKYNLVTKMKMWNCRCTDENMNQDSLEQRRGRPRSAVGQLSQSAKPFVPSQGPMDQSLANDFAALNLASGMPKVRLWVWRHEYSSQIWPLK